MMNAFSLFIVAFLLCDPRNCAWGKDRKLSRNQDDQLRNQRERGDAARNLGDVEETPPDGEKPRAFKPQFFVTGPVPEAPSAAYRVLQLQTREVKPQQQGPVVKSAGGSRLSDSEKSILLNAHNEFRSLTSNPTAANMIKVKWSTELADMAQGWADECTFAHGNPDNISPFHWVGQNIWVGTGSRWAVYDMVQSWYDEVEIYNYATDGCSGVCGHYTQLVWADTTHVGCALQTCSPIHGLGWSVGTNLVCNYGEGGNYIGMKPYISGTPCSQCPMGYTTCLQGRLCAETGTESANPTTQSPLPLIDLGPIVGEEAARGDAEEGTGNLAGVQSECGGDLTKKSGEFFSPNWPSPYTANQECEWIIDAEADQTITVTVTYMDIELDNQCGFDYLLITIQHPRGDGWSGTKYCGNVPLDPIISEGRRVRIVFYSDSSVHRGGFKATYSISDEEPELALSCGGLISATRGTLKSPNYPDDYGNNMDCKWTFEAPSGKRVRIKFNVIDIEDEEQCKYDRVTIQLGNERIPMTLCGNEKPPGSYISLSNRTVLHFQSDDSTGRKGFSVGYRHI